MVARFLAGHVARFAFTVLAAGFLGATLVYVAPAFGVSEEELDPRLNRETVEALRDRGRVGLVEFYGRFLRGAVRGDFGISPSLNRPVAELLRERFPLTLRYLGAGAGLGVVAGVIAAAMVMLFRSPLVRAGPVAASCLFLSIPSAALALICLILAWPPWFALATLLFPRVYRYAMAFLGRAEAAPYVVAARARGLAPWRILARHIVPVAAPQLLSVVGMAISVGFPALVPIEAVSDSAGIGQLAWKAALARDLPVLVTLTMAASVIVLMGNAAADWSADSLRRNA
jgi:ABC-type dipeptide/oligopeptide/nickel transport system permease component